MKKDIWADFYRDTLWREGDWTKERLLRRKTQPPYKFIGEYLHRLEKVLKGVK